MTRRDLLYFSLSAALAVEVQAYVKGIAPPAPGLWLAALALAALRALWLSWPPLGAAVDALGAWWAFPGVEAGLQAIYREALIARQRERERAHHPHRTEEP